VEFCAAPAPAYYARLAARAADTPAVLARLPELADVGVLLDTDAGGNLLQIFTRSPHSPSALFYELVERQGHQGFGTANIRALFESLEADPAFRSLTTTTAHEG
jgi:4-hydroxymandelate synthase